jgi:CBS domain-containing protein
MTKDILIRDVMVTNVITCSKQETIRDVANKMKKHRIGVVVVVEKKGNIEGIISERDILNKVVCLALDAKTITVNEVMTKKVIVGTPTMTDAQIAALFTQYNIKKLPIAKNKKLVGIVTQTDLLKLFSIKWAL